MEKEFDVTVEAGDTTAPTVSKVERHDGTSAQAQRTNDNTLTFRVTFSETVENVDSTDFAASGTTATASNVTGSGSQYVVTVSGGNLATRNGAVGLTFASGQNITDEADNALSTTLPTGTNYETYTVDNTAPTATLTAPANHDGSTAFDVTVTFSEDVTDFDDAADITVTGGNASIASNRRAELHGQHHADGHGQRDGAGGRQRRRGHRRQRQRPLGDQDGDLHGAAARRHDAERAQP